MKQIVSGGGSHLYPLIKNVSNKVFYKTGLVNIDTRKKVIEIIDSNCNLLYKEQITS